MIAYRTGKIEVWNGETIHAKDIEWFDGILEDYPLNTIAWIEWRGEHLYLHRNYKSTVQFQNVHGTWGFPTKLAW